MPKDKPKKKKSGKGAAKKQSAKHGDAPAAKIGPAVSPLAPPGGFPDLPHIAGIRYAAVEAGVRYRDRLDVMLVAIAKGASIAGVFTRSATRSAPVLWCEDCLAAHRSGAPSRGGFAILVNSGNANAFTGRAGREAVRTTAEAVAGALKLLPQQVLLASTGVIGEPLPADRIAAKVPVLVDALSEGAATLAARAILTTDTFAKGATRSVALDGVSISIAGIAKGSGMIAPDMATMLAFVFTDAGIGRDLLQTMVTRASAATFNCITVDGDTSTSDTLLVAATGKAAMTPIETARDPRAKVFEAALTEVLRDLAHQVVRDGEGATKFVTIAVSGAASAAAARTIGFAIANSPLVKTAIAGGDPNWGRIVMAVGKSGQRADRDTLSIRLGSIAVAANGAVAPSYTEAEGADYMRCPEIEIGVDLGIGRGSATVWTCDLTHRYIEINADYRS